MNVRTRCDDLLGIFLPFIRDHGCSYGGISDIDQDPVVQLIANLYAHARIAGYIFIPASAIGKLQSRPVNGGQIKLAVIGDTICRDE